jgi:hypothetical protein
MNKKGQSSSGAAHAPMNYSIAFKGNLSRGMKLKVIALQMPQVQVFLKKFSSKVNISLLRLKFDRWLQFNKAARDQFFKILKRKNEAATSIQRIMRGILGIRLFVRLKRAREIEVAIEAKKRVSMYVIQCFVMVLVRKRRALKLARLYQTERRKYYAKMIQKAIRGFLSRGHTIALEKLKLIRQLRKWSHGVSSHLLNMKGTVECSCLEYSAVLLLH